MKKRLIVIDDDNDLRNLLQIALKTEGYEVTSYSNGKEFLDTVDSEPPADLYIIDINLGGLTGYEVCQRMRSSERIGNKSIILISANPDVQQFASQAAANDYMIKPISLKVLFQKIRDLIG